MSPARVGRDLSLTCFPSWGFMFSHVFPLGISWFRICNLDILQVPLAAFGITKIGQPPGSNVSSCFPSWGFMISHLWQGGTYKTTFSFAAKPYVSSVRARRVWKRHAVHRARRENERVRD